MEWQCTEWGEWRALQSVTKSAEVCNLPTSYNKTEEEQVQLPVRSPKYSFSKTVGLIRHRIVKAGTKMSQLSGVIFGNGLCKNYTIDSKCPDTVHIVSETFKTNGTDTLQIEGISYSGNDRINQVVKNRTNFAFEVKSHQTSSRFKLKWECTQWGEWQQLSDGTCRFQRMPLKGDTSVKGIDKPRRNSICGNT